MQSSTCSKRACTAAVRRASSCRVVKSMPVTSPLAIAASSTEPMSCALAPDDEMVAEFTRRSISAGWDSIQPTRTPGPRILEKVLLPSTCMPP